ncbi:response regulator transcription factor [Rhizobium sp. S152]|uniref:response regulator n=1 Tax=Rhizobium sp. S152 TaxID=3055038 RepID=UPI0025AA16C7|nr:response regulator transcription factor [Rhizobium sp. S152]MDM9625333.1 response regulator transcription factor [Rhizobium sp. S152]
MKTYRIVVADDHPIYRNGLVRSLEDEPEFEVVGEASTADDAVAAYREHSPDALLLDLSMPGGGHAALATILGDYPDAVVIVLTASEDDDDLFYAVKGGARGYVLKGVDASELVDIVERVIAGESYVSPDLASRILTELKPAAPRLPADNMLASLTPREEQILALVAEGNSNKEVARRLGLQEKTIKHNMTRILQKLKARNRTEAAMLLRDTRARE